LFWCHQRWDTCRCWLGFLFSWDAHSARYVGSCRACVIFQDMLQVLRIPCIRSCRFTRFLCTFTSPRPCTPLGLRRKVESSDEGINADQAAQALYKGAPFPSRNRGNVLKMPRGAENGRAHITGNLIICLFSASTRGQPIGIIGF
jgi:hypothetical protein